MSPYGPILGPILFLALLYTIAPLNVLVSASELLFDESFDEPYEGKWIVSEEDYKDMSKNHEDYGLLVREPERKYAIVKELPVTVDPKDWSLVLQYEARLQNGLECGGAYLKFFCPQKDGIEKTASAQSRKDVTHFGRQATHLFSKTY